MVTLKTKDLQALVIDLKALSSLSKEIDLKLTDELREMAPQFENDNYGTDDWTKKGAMAQVVKKMDSLNNLSEISEALVSGIEQVLKTIK